MRVRGLEDQLHMTQNQLDDMRDQRDQWQKQAQQILITNQMSQKQAEDLKQELREREARERAARQKQMEERLRRQAENENARHEEHGNGTTHGRNAYLEQNSSKNPRLIPAEPIFGITTLLIKGYTLNSVALNPYWWPNPCK